MTDPSASSWPFADDDPADDDDWDDGPPRPPSETELWRTARRLFEDGVSGTDVCAALKLPSSTFWKRAGQEGWLRRDTPSSAPPPPRPIDPDQPTHDVSTAVGIAWRRVCDALDAGHAGEAARWTRVYAQIKASTLNEMRAAAAAERRATRENSVDTLRATQSLRQAAEAQLALIKARPGTPDVEKVEWNSADSTRSPAADPDRPLNRAERRRRMRSGGEPPGLSP